MATTAFELIGRIALDGQKKVQDGLKNVSGKAEETGSRFDGMKKSAKKLGKGVVGLGAIAAGAFASGFAATSKIAADLDKIAKNSTKLGVSTDAYQEMDYWAGQNGMSTETMERAVGRLNQRMGLAADGNEKYADALQRLGVDMDKVKDGSLETEDALAQSIQTLSEMDSEAEKSAAASELFGTKMARELMPALQDGSLSLEDAKAKAEELGIVMDEESTQQAAAFGDTWDDLTRSFGSFGKQIFAELMPAFQAIMDWVLDHMPQIKETFNTVFDAIKVGIDWVKEFFTTNESTFTGIWNTIQLFLGYAKTFLVETFEFLKLTIQTALEYILPFIQEQLANMRAFWDENGEQIMTAVKNFTDFVMNVINIAMPFIKQIIEDTWNAIKSIIEGVITVIQGIIKVFTGIFTGDFQLAWEGVKEIFLGGLKAVWGFLNLWIFGKILGGLKTFGKKAIEPFKKLFEGGKTQVKNLKDFISGIVEDIKGFFTNLGDKLGFSIPKPKLPKFTLKNWSKNPMDWIDNMPSIGIDWRAQGGFLDGAQLIGAGEVNEAILPLENRKNMQPFAQAVADNLKNMQGSSGGQRIEVPIELNGREILRAIIPDLDRELARKRDKQGGLVNRGNL